MPLSRTELIAKGLAHAGHMTGQGIPVTTLIDSTHFNHLSPEEKIDTLAQYSDLIDPNARVSPSDLTYIKRGIAGGMLAAIPVAIGAGVFTAPSAGVFKRALGSRVAMGDIAARVLGPVGLTLGAGALVGSIAGMIQSSKDRQTNRYIRDSIIGIRSERDPSQKRINAAALLAMSNDINMARRANSSIGESMAFSNLPKLVDKQKYREVLPAITGPRTVAHSYEDGAPVLDDNNNPTYSQVDVTTPYDDWSRVHGINGGRDLK